MRRLGHLTEQRKHFVEAYCRLGNGNLSLMQDTVFLENPFPSAQSFQELQIYSILNPMLGL